MPVLEAARQPADPVALFAGRRSLQAALGVALSTQISAALTEAEALAGTSGGRALLTQLLELGVAAGDDAAIDAASDMVMDQNMTLSQGALRALIHHEGPARLQALAAFHHRWQSDSLVMEKWFSMEAMSSVGGSVSRLAELMQHPGFDPKNPNKIRSVIGAFMAGNPSLFHAEDGSGYAFIAEQLVELDGRNPQVAARMALPLTRMAGYDDARQSRMRDALATVQKGAQSNDLKEVVGKAL